MGYLFWLRIEDAFQGLCRAVWWSLYTTIGILLLMGAVFHFNPWVNFCYAYLFLFSFFAVLVLSVQLAYLFLAILLVCCYARKRGLELEDAGEGLIQHELIYVEECFQWDKSEFLAQLEGYRQKYAQKSQPQIVGGSAA